MSKKPVPSSLAPQPESLDYPISYGGRDFVARFSIRAASRLKDHWGFATDPEGTPNRRTGDQKLAARLEMAELEDVPIMFWATLRSNHPEITVEEVEDLVDRHGAAPLQVLLAKVLAAAMPPDAKKK